MNLCHKFSLVAAGLFSAGSCFGGLTGLNDGDVSTLNVQFSGSYGFSASYDGGSTISTTAGLFEIDVDKDASIVGDWVFFCFELSETISNGDQLIDKQFTYYDGDGLKTPDSLLTTDTQLSLMQDLFVQQYRPRGSKASGWTSDEAAAFQLAVWEITYDYTDLNVETGAGFNVAGSDTVTALANTWLAGISDTGFYNDSLFGFIAPDRQNQISYIPEPSLIGLQALFVLGLMLRRRRK